MREKLQSSFMLLTSVVGAVVLIAWAIDVSLRHDLRAAQAEAQTALARRVAERIDSAVLKRQGDISDIAANVAQLVEKGERDYARYFAYGRFERTLFPNGIYMVSVSGRILAWGTPEAGVERMPQGEVPLWLRSHLFSTLDKTLHTGKPVIGEAFKSVSGQPGMVLAAPIRLPDGEVIGAMAGISNPLDEEFIGGIAELQQGTPQWAFLITRDRLMVAHPDRDRLLQRDIPVGADLLLDQAIEDDAVVGETTAVLGPPALTAFKRLQATGWILGVGYPLEAADVPLRELSLKLWGGAAALLVLLLAAIGYFAGRARRP